MKFIKFLLPMLCGLCFFCYSTVGGAVSVAADGEVYTTLTVQQTLALYGSEIQGTFYNKNSERHTPITFHYAYTMSNWRPNDYTSSPTYIFNMDGSVQGSASDVKSKLEGQDFLVYVCVANSYTYPFPTYNGDNNISNVYLDLSFSVPFTGITSWRQMYMWSNWYNYDRYPAERSYITNQTSFDTVYKKTPYYYLYSAYDYHKMSLATFPAYPAVSESAVPDNEDKLMYASVINNDISYGAFEEFDLSNQSASLTFCDKYDMNNFGNGIEQLIYQRGWGQGINGHYYCLFFFVACPQVSSLNPMPPLDGSTAPPVTGTGSNGTYSTAEYETFPTVDLSALESGVGTMVQEINEGNYYERIQIDQLNTIIQQLNDIYAQMVARGEIAVDLVAAGSAQRFDTSILDQVQNAATSYTIAQLPQDYAGNGATGIGAFIAQVVGVDPIFMTIGLFSIGFAIFCWFVFRGRGGV